MIFQGDGIKKRDYKRSYKEVTEALRRLGIHGFFINDDMTIDVNCDVNISKRSLSKLPDNIRFGSVKGSFDVSNNLFTDMSGFPSFIGGNFFIYGNNLTTLKGCPDRVCGKFFCHNNTKKFTINEVIAVCDVDYVYV